MSWQPDGWQPDGQQPDGWQPDGSVVAYPSISASRRISLPSGGVWVVDPDAEEYCEVDWSGVLPPSVTLSSVAYTMPAALTNLGQAINTVAGKSALIVDGAAHGLQYAIAIVATLSDASTISFTAPLRCFNA